MRPPPFSTRWEKACNSGCDTSLVVPERFQLVFRILADEVVECRQQLAAVQFALSYASICQAQFTGGPVLGGSVPTARLRNRPGY